MTRRQLWLARATSYLERVEANVAVHGTVPIQASVAPCAPANDANIEETCGDVCPYTSASSPLLANKDDDDSIAELQEFCGDLTKAMGGICATPVCNEDDVVAHAGSQGLFVNVDSVSTDVMVVAQEDKNLDTNSHFAMDHATTVVGDIDVVNEIVDVSGVADNTRLCDYLAQISSTKSIQKPMVQDDVTVVAEVVTIPETSVDSNNDPGTVEGRKLDDFMAMIFRLVPTPILTTPKISCKAAPNDTPRRSNRIEQ